MRTLVADLTGILRYAGQLGILAGQASAVVARGRLNLRQTVNQMARFGVDSMPIVLVTVLFSGMVLALHTAQQMSQVGAGRFVGGLVVVSVVRELAPVLTAVVVAARVGSAIAAEIGTMKVTEQIDALRALATPPVRFLVVPRLLAGMITMPALTVISALTGAFGGYLVAVRSGVSSYEYLSSARNFLDLHDVWGGLLKTVVFGVIIALVSCHQGLRAQGGADGVGRATTAAVVLSIAFIYAADFFLSAVIF